MVKTNAVRLLDGLVIRYELREYKVDPEDLSAESVAAKIELPPEQLFKTLAVLGDWNGIYLVVIAGNDSAKESIDGSLNSVAAANETKDVNLQAIGNCAADRPWVQRLIWNSRRRSIRTKSRNFSKVAMDQAFTPDIRCFRTEQFAREMAIAI